MTTFDLHRHLRARARRAEKRCVGLEDQLTRAVRLLGIVCQYAAGTEWSELLRLAEEIDEQEQRAAAWTPERIGELLRETAS